jgi:hypothetical protein
MEDLFRALPKLIQEAGELAALREPLAFAAWKRIAGESLEKHARAVRLEEKRLVVAVADDVWKKHLEALSGQMIFKLNSLFGAETITFLEFRVDSKMFAAARNEQDQKMREKENFDLQAKEEITPGLQQVADEIKDDKLRELFLKAAGNCLVRKKHLYA